jgi:hypothetical protein
MRFKHERIKQGKLSPLETLLVKHMNASQRNSNPGNLRYAKQKEATGKDDKGFAVFPDGPSGWRALHNQIKLDQKRGLLLFQFISKYAPPNENNTSKYLEFVVDELHTQSWMTLQSLSVYALAGVIAAMEGYYNKTR